MFVVLGAIFNIVKPLLVPVLTILTVFIAAQPMWHRVVALSRYVEPLYMEEPETLLQKPF
jgi:hypothetical protein